MPPKRPPKKASRRPSHPSPVEPAHTTPLSSTYPSAPATNAEDDLGDEVAQIPMNALKLADSTETLPDTPPQEEVQPFRFLDLPAELRNEIYAYFFGDFDAVIDIDPRNCKTVHKKLGILRTCRVIYAEASHFFYSTRPFRIFPTQSSRFFKMRKPLLARLTPAQRKSLTSLELRLGPGWNKPPRCWTVNAALKLSQCVNVHKLTVFVQFDPSEKYWEGFRKADGFYEEFSRKLLGDILAGLPSLDRVVFDAWPNIKKKGAMMLALLDVTLASGKPISWGPERGWTDEDDEAEAQTETKSTDADSAIAM